MAKTKPQERERDRVLTDGEVKAIWNAPDTVFRRYVRVLLLTAVRRGEAAMGHSSEIVDGVWTIPAKRMKSKLDFVVS